MAIYIKDFQEAERKEKGKIVRLNLGKTLRYFSKDILDFRFLFVDVCR